MVVVFVWVLVCEVGGDGCVDEGEVVFGVGEGGGYGIQGIGRGEGSAIFGFGGVVELRIGGCAGGDIQFADHIDLDGGE